MWILHEKFDPTLVALYRARVHFVGGFPAPAAVTFQSTVRTPPVPVGSQCWDSWTPRIYTLVPHLGTPDAHEAGSMRRVWELAWGSSARQMENRVWRSAMLPAAAVRALSPALRHKQASWDLPALPDPRAGAVVLGWEPPAQPHSVHGASAALPPCAHTRALSTRRHQRKPNSSQSPSMVAWQERAVGSGFVFITTICNL